MNPSLRIILFALFLCIFSVGFMLFIDGIFLSQLGDWTMNVASKYLVFQWTTSDKNLIRWFPLIVGIVSALKGFRDIQIFALRVCLTFLSVMISVMLAIITAMFTWTDKAALSPFLPHFVKYQPFEHYWTIFIFLGVLMPLIPLLKKKIKV